MIHELFENQVEQAPDKAAIFFDESQLTYRELNDRAESLARQLRALGVGPDVLVALLLERSLDMVVGLLGILKAGGAYIPLDPSHPGSRIVAVLNDAQPLLLLSDDRLASKLPPHRTPLVTIDGHAASETRTAEPLHQATLSTLAYVIYTSGSTGKPKGVEIEHRAVVNFLKSMQRQPGLGRDDTMLAVTTLAFDIAVLEIVLPLVCGASVVIASAETARDGAALAALMKQRGVTVMQATPSTFRLLLDAGWMGSPQLKILCGGEAWSAELAKSLLSCCGSLWNMYGPTETTIWSAVARVKEGQPVAIGPPIANTKLYVLDRTLQLVPVGVSGELCIGGAGLARGYLHRPELTRERFVPDPYSDLPGARIYRTGDLVRRKTNGMLEFLGRLDHQVKIRGHRIELGEIETTLEQYPGIKQCVVIVPEEAGSEPRLVAYFVPAESAVVPTKELQQWLSGRLPSYMIPSAFVVLSSFPLNSSGKIDRKALPSPDRTAQKEVASLAPRTRTEEVLTRIWCEVLGVVGLSVRDDFFNLGGNSILAAQTIGKVNQAFGIRLNVSAVFGAPTIEALAPIVEQSEQNDEAKAKILPLRIGKMAPPIYFVGAGPVEYGIAQRLSCDRSIFVVDLPLPAEWRHPSGQSESPNFEKLGELYSEALRPHIGAQGFILAGYSFSGKVAVETARAMRRTGENVASVLLIDAFAWIGLTFGTASRIWSSIWQQPPNAGGRTSSAACLLKSGQLLWWGWLQAPRVIRSRWKKNRLPSSFVDSAGVPMDLSELDVVRRVAGATYQPQTLDASAILFRARLPNEELLPNIDMTNGWGSLFTRGLQVIAAKGDHWSIVSSEQNLAELAKQISMVLEMQAQDPNLQPVQTPHSTANRRQAAIALT
jgi:amino acid adenylation domain-containing protein